MEQQKLTLRIEKDLIEKAKHHARERDISVSGMVAGFFNSLGRSDDARGVITTRLRGSLKPESDGRASDEEDYLKYREEKHG